MYSFFNNYDKTCLKSLDCQQSIAQVVGSTNVVVFNAFTIGSLAAASGAFKTAIMQNSTQA